jgi:predicted GTPase
MGSSGSKSIKENNKEQRMSNSYNYYNPNPNMSNPNNDIRYNNNFERVDDMDFRTKFPCRSDKNSLQNLINNFINRLIIQDFFYEIDNSEDTIYGLLKKKEKKDLTEFFNSNNSSFIDKVKDKINEILNKSFNFDNSISNILNKEKAEQAYTNKIKREIAKLNKDKKKFEIKYLTVMLVGKSGVGKSTLINNLLKLSPAYRAKVGNGRFQTVLTHSYQSEAIPILRLVDTRGIELNIDYGADAVKADAEKFINKQIESNDPNNFVQCIWYCITGNRFEQVEIDLLNSLKNSYEDNKIPIIIVYTQATDNNTMNEMQKYIKEKNIDANFIKVLAERKELVNNSYLEAFGMDELVKVTLEKCKKAMRGEMRSVMTDNISKNIKEILINENSYIIDYIYQQRILDFVSNYKTVRNDNNFVDYIIYLISFNIKFFLDKGMSKESAGYLKDTDFFDKIVDNYITCYKNWANEKIKPALNKYPIEFIDYQVKIQKEKNKDILIKNKRCIKDFIENSKKFLSDNYYYCAQVYFIYYFILNISINISNSFENNINSLLKEISSKESIKNLISECFLNKFSEFEKRVANFFSTFKYDNNNQNYDFHLNNYDFNHQNYQMNNDNINNSNYADNLPSRSEIYNAGGNDYSNLYPNI